MCSVSCIDSHIHLIASFHTPFTVASKTVPMFSTDWIHISLCECKALPWVTRTFHSPSPCPPTAWGFDPRWGTEGEQLATASWTRNNRPFQTASTWGATSASSSPCCSTCWWRKCSGNSGEWGSLASSTTTTGTKCLEWGGACLVVLSFIIYFSCRDCITQGSSL